MRDATPWAQADAWTGNAAAGAVATESRGGDGGILGWQPAVVGTANGVNTPVEAAGVRRSVRAGGRRRGSAPTGRRAARPVAGRCRWSGPVNGGGNRVASERGDHAGETPEAVRGAGGGAPLLGAPQVVPRGVHRAGRRRVPGAPVGGGRESPGRGRRRAVRRRGAGHQQGSAQWRGPAARVPTECGARLDAGLPIERIFNWIELGATSPRWEVHRTSALGNRPEGNTQTKRKRGPSPHEQQRKITCRRLRRAVSGAARPTRSQGGRVGTRGYHGYTPEEYIRALYPYPLRIRAGDAYPKCSRRKRGEDISILFDRNCKIISDPYPRYESQDTCIQTIMRLPAPGEFSLNTVDLSFRVLTIAELMSEHLAATSDDPARPR